MSKETIHVNASADNQLVACILCLKELRRADATVGVCHLYACSNHLKKSEDRLWFRGWVRFISNRAMTLERKIEVEI